MSGFFPSRRVVLFDGSSGQSSTFTSNSILIADYDNLTVSWLTDTTATSRFTIEGTNSDGLTVTIPDASWSVVTTVLADGIYSIDPGIRWLRGRRASNESLAIAELQLRA